MAATQTIRLHDKTFRLSIPHDRLVGAIGEVAQRINRDYARRECPLFLGVLNGSFMYMAELLQHIDFTCEVSFVKLASYNGTSSTGAVPPLPATRMEPLRRDDRSDRGVCERQSAMEYLSANT